MTAGRETWQEMTEARRVERVAEAAGELARFDVYPPEVNGKAGWCLVCGLDVAEGSGLICLGHDNGGTFAAPVHADCGQLVTAEHNRQDAARRDRAERDRRAR